MLVKKTDTLGNDSIYVLIAVYLLIHSVEVCALDEHETRCTQDTMYIRHECMHT
jgi:hypothetical protein